MCVNAYVRMKKWGKMKMERNMCECLCLSKRVAKIISWREMFIFWMSWGFSLEVSIEGS